MFIQPTAFQQPLRTIPENKGTVLGIAHFAQFVDTNAGIRITPLIDSDYLNYVMQTQFYWVYCQNVRSDAIGQSNINAEKLKNFIYPLPPLHEQKRIAKKLNSIFTKIK